MFRHNLLLVYRNLTRQKLFSFVTLIGLTTGMAGTLVIYLYVRSDLSHDRFHEKAEHIYRINQSNIHGENDDLQLARTGPGVANALKAEIPEVEMISSIHTPGDFLVSYINRSKQIVSFDQENIIAADSNFFRMFNFSVIKGNPETCLRLPQSVVITESIAQKYFEDAPPLGKLLQFGVDENLQNFEVTAVIEDIPDNSYLDFDMLLSMTSFSKVEENSWSWIWTQLETFILLDKNSDIESVQKKLENIPHKYAEPSNLSFDDYLKTGRQWKLFLQPLTQIHLHSGKVVGNFNITGNSKITYTLLGTAVFILLLSCINFINLSTAQFIRRVKEASIRKILGLGRKELVVGYFMEVFSFCWLSLIAACAITWGLLPWFIEITGKTLTMNLLQDTGLILILISLLAFTTILSGGIPAVFLNGFHPVEAIKGKLKTGQEGKALRNGLVVFQFAVSIVLIICTTIVYQQLSFFSNKDLGFNKENLLVLENVEMVNNGETLTNEISNIPGIVSASFCASVPLDMGNDFFRSANLGDKDFKLNFTASDEKYISTLGVPLIIGRNFSPDIPGDANRVIINETAVKKLGWEVDESVIGKIIDYPNAGAKYEVIGVVKDYHFASLETLIEPMGIFHIDSKVFKQRKFALLRIAPQNNDGWESTFSALKQIWKQYAKDIPFNYEFVDQTFAAKFRSQQHFGKSLQIMAGLALLIACLGLLGMVIYTVERRTKEIAIRKISGANIRSILLLISQTYTKLITIAFVVGAPIAYWLMHQWLVDFGNRITPSVWVFIMTGLGTMLFALLITSYHSLKAALTNPIDVLKDE